MRQKTTVLFILFIFASCADEIEQKKRVKKNGYFIEANFVDDSLIDGQANFYNLDGTLSRVEYYSKGTKHGPSVTYYPSGKIWDTSNYYYGLRHGKHFIYLENGKLNYEDYYYYGREMGPHTHYEGEYIKRYFFSDFESREVYSATYDSGNALTNSSGSFLSFALSDQTVDSQKELGLFMFLVNPPHMKIQFGLGLSDSLGIDRKELYTFRPDRVFVDTTLPLLPSGRHYYVFANYESNSGEKKYHAVVLH